MFKLYKEEGLNISLYGTYATESLARDAINEYCKDNNFESYYWNCYLLPEGDPMAGALHVDFGSWHTFFIIHHVEG